MIYFKGFKRHQELLRSISSQNKKKIESNKASKCSGPTEAALRIPLSVSVLAMLRLLCLFFTKALT